VRRVLLIAVALAACTSKAERARRVTAFRQSRDSLLATDVVKALQPPAAIGRLIYEPPANLSYDSLLAKRPELAAKPGRTAR
jgi:hypothetical protein